MTQAAARSAANVLRLELGQIRRAPVTLAFLVVLWVLGAATGSLLTGPSPVLLDGVGAGVPALAGGRVHTVLTAALWAPNLAGYVVVSAVALLVVTRVERAWGTRRFLLLTLVTQAVGVAVGLGAVQLASWADGTWSTDLVTSSAVGPSTLLVGVVLAHTARLSALWRRRVRLGFLVVLLTMVLYGGLLQDVLRLTTALVGLGIGAALARSSPLHVRARVSRHETRTLVSVLLAATAVGPVLAAFSPSAAGPLAVLRYLFTAPEADAATLDSVCADPATVEVCIDLQVQLRFDGVGPTVLSVLPAVLVLLFAVGLRRGRASAWWGAVVLHAVLAALGAVLAVAVVRAPSTDVAALALDGTRGTIGVVAPLVQPLLVLAVLLSTRGAFPLAAPHGTWRRTGAVLAGALAAAFVAYLGLGAVLRHQFDPTPSLVQLALDFPLRLVPAGYLGVVEPTFLPRTAPATALFEWTGIAVWSVVVAVVLRSSTRTAVRGTSTDLDRARQLLVQHGDHALSYLTTWAGTSYWFTPDGTSYVAYRVTGGVAITTGDPVGPPAERTATVRGFVEHCVANSWTPCFYSVTEAVTKSTDDMGWARVQVAEETVLPLGELAFTGKRFQDVRTAINKAAKAGITAEWISYPAAPRVLTDQIEAISEEWVSDKGIPEMGFTLGGLDELDDTEVRCLVAVDGERTVHGITSWLPVHRDGHPVGWTLDFMRRRDTGFKGVMEFLIGSAALTFQEEGAEFVSLSGAPLARIDPGASPTGLHRLLDVMGRTLEPVYGFRSLLAFKAKFQPEYQPLFMCYPEVAALPRIGNALTHAYLPGLTVRQGLRVMSKL